MNPPVIETRDLTRYYGERKVLGELNLSVPRGSILGLLGPNGAGKSTTIRILMGLVEPTRGEATVLGHDCRNLPPELRARIGYLAEGHYVYDWMTVQECERFQASFFPHWNRDLFHDVIRHFRLEEKAKAGHLSRGQRAGLCLALTLAPEPELIILDDPALGLDPMARRSLLESMVFVTRKEDRTIIFSSHLLADVERVADQIAIIDHGTLRAHSSIDEFRGRVRQWKLRFHESIRFPNGLQGILHQRTEGTDLFLVLQDTTPEILDQLQKLGADSMEEIPMDLEEAFVRFCGGDGKSFFDSVSGVTR